MTPVTRPDAAESLLERGGRPLYVGRCTLGESWPGGGTADGPA
jgi:hypothetical protein